MNLLKQWLRRWGVKSATIGAFLLLIFLCILEDHQARHSLVIQLPLEQAVILLNESSTLLINLELPDNTNSYEVKLSIPRADTKDLRGINPNYVREMIRPLGEFLLLEDGRVLTIIPRNRTFIAERCLDRGVTNIGINQQNLFEAIYILSRKVDFCLELISAPGVSRSIAPDLSDPPPAHWPLNSIPRVTIATNMLTVRDALTTMVSQQGGAYWVARHENRLNLRDTNQCVNGLIALRVHRSHESRSVAFFPGRILEP